MENQTPLRTPRPESFTVEQGAMGLQITYRWFSAQYIFLAFFSLIWDAFLVFWYTMAFTSNAPWIMFVFPLIHLAIGVGITYTAVAGFLNRTTVTVGQGKLTIQHAPLYWPGNRTVASNDVTQLFTEERVARSRNGTRVRYQLSMITRDDKKVRLISNLDEPDKARFLERKIEEYLGIENRTVEGETQR
jgi:hypothetical protein